MVLLVSKRVRTVGMSLRGPAWMLCLFRYPAGSWSQNALVWEPLWQSRVDWKQSFALYGGNDKSVLTDNPPFFCFDLTSLAHPFWPNCGVNGQHSLKKGDARKRWGWESKRKIVWSHPHVVVYSPYEWSFWMTWSRVRKPHDGVIHLKSITDSVLLKTLTDQLWNIYTCWTQYNSSFTT